MFDIGAQEVLVIVIVAILVIGPKDMPAALRAAGRWIGKLRRMSGQFRSGLDSMIREAEMEDMEKKWKAQNEKIMREHPEGGPAEMEQTGAYPPKARAPAARSTAKLGDQTQAAPPASPPASPASGPNPASAESAVPSAPPTAPAADTSASAGASDGKKSN